MPTPTETPAFTPETGTLILAPASSIEAGWTMLGKASAERVMDCTVVQPELIDPAFFHKFVGSHSLDKTGVVLADGTIRLKFATPETAEQARATVWRWLTGQKLGSAVTLHVRHTSTTVLKADDAARDGTGHPVVGLSSSLALPAGAWTVVCDHDEQGRLVGVHLTR